MFKSSYFLEEMGFQASTSLTPIRDYDNDYFHRDDDKLPMTNRFLYGKPKTCGESARASIKSCKRPASLVLCEQTETSNKKQYSPLNLRNFTDVINLNQDNEHSPKEPAQEFFSIVRHLFESETAYVETMETSIDVYRRTLNENRSFRNRLIQQDSHDEVLLFGNIETISSISRLFLSVIENSLTSGNPLRTVDDKFWDELNSISALQDRLLQQFDIGKAFNLHFLRIKSTYLSYSVTHGKQKELLELLRAGNPQLFQKWYDCCMKSANTMRLEAIFERPIKRLKEWTEILVQLLASSQNLLSEHYCANVSNALNQYESFIRDVTNETKEFDNNAMYDFSLTPSEIIQSYGPESKFERKTLKSTVKSAPRSSLQELDSVLLCVKTPKRESRNTTSRSNSIFSGSSSRYSGDSTIVPLSEANLILSSSESHLRAETAVDLTLADHVTKLKRAHRGLLAFKNVIGKEDMLSILDINLKHAKLWEAVIDRRADLNPIVSSDEGSKSRISMYSSHIERLQKQREEAIIMKVDEMERSVKGPLSMIICHCECVRSHLRDLNALKKDYLSYLRERKSSAHDVKRDILGKHFEQMQAKMLHELPKFIELAHKIIEAIILNYHRKMLRYLEISAGGEKSLIDDLELLGGLKRDVGKNLDILENYSASRYRIKRMVRDDWQFAQDQTASRVLRKLFEL